MRQNVELSGIYLTRSAVGARSHLHSYRTDKRGAASARSAFFLAYRVSMAGNCTFLLHVPTIRLRELSGSARREFKVTRET
jgi:hypothetical protein